MRILALAGPATPLAKLATFLIRSGVILLFPGCWGFGACGFEDGVCNYGFGVFSGVSRTIRGNFHCRFLSRGCLGGSQIGIGRRLNPYGSSDIAASYGWRTAMIFDSNLSHSPRSALLCQWLSMTACFLETRWELKTPFPFLKSFLSTSRTTSLTRFNTVLWASGHGSRGPRVYQDV
jgi:hypothetical protein